MAAVVIPAAFLASDQLNGRLLRGDKAVWVGLFGAPLAVIVTLGDNAHGPTFGDTPVSFFAVAALLLVILQRAVVTRPLASVYEISPKVGRPSDL
jgi:hypothetical protein